MKFSNDGDQCECNDAHRDPPKYDAKVRNLVCSVCVIFPFLNQPWKSNTMQNNQEKTLIKAEICKPSCNSKGCNVNTNVSAKTSYSKTISQNNTLTNSTSRAKWSSIHNRGK